MFSRLSPHQHTDTLAESAAFQQNPLGAPTDHSSHPVFHFPRSSSLPATELQGAQLGCRANVIPILQKYLMESSGFYDAECWVPLPPPPVKDTMARFRQEYPHEQWLSEDSLRHYVTDVRKILRIQLTRGQDFTQERHDHLAPILRENPSTSISRLLLDPRITSLVPQALSGELSKIRHELAAEYSAVTMPLPAAQAASGSSGLEMLDTNRRAPLTLEQRRVLYGALTDQRFEKHSRLAFGTAMRTYPLLADVPNSAIEYYRKQIRKGRTQFLDPEFAQTKALRAWMTPMQKATVARIYEQNPGQRLKAFRATVASSGTVAAELSALQIDNYFKKRRNEQPVAAGPMRAEAMERSQSRSSSNGSSEIGQSEGEDFENRMESESGHRGQIDFDAHGGFGEQEGVDEQEGFAWAALHSSFEAALPLPPGSPIDPFDLLPAFSPAPLPVHSAALMPPPMAPQLRELGELIPLLGEFTNYGGSLPDAARNAATELALFYAQPQPQPQPHWSPGADPYAQFFQ